MFNSITVLIVDTINLMGVLLKRVVEAFIYFIVPLILIAAGDYLMTSQVYAVRLAGDFLLLAGVITAFVNAWMYCMQQYENHLSRNKL